MDRSRLLTILRLAEDADAARATPLQDAADAALTASADDVIVALEHLVKFDPATALVLAGRLSGFWQDAGLVHEGRALTQRALAAGAGSAADGVHTAGVARATLVAADLAFRQGDQEGAAASARTAIDLAQAAGDRQTAGLAWLDLARVAYRAGDADAIETTSRAARSTAPDDPLVTRGVLHMLAWAAHTAGNLEEARSRFETSLALRRAQGGALGIASELANLGDLAMDAGDPSAAAAWFSKALDVARDLDSAYMMVNTLPSLAALAVAAHPEIAARLFGAADAASRNSGLVPDPGADRSEARVALRDAMTPLRFQELLDEGSVLTAQGVAELGSRIASPSTRRTRGHRVVETVVVGAGQAGLVMSRLLSDAGREHVVLERRATLGGGWQDRWDAFRLVTPNWTVGVPGLDYQGDEPDGFMPRDEIIAHWRRYADVIDAPVELDTDVTSLVTLDEGHARFRLTTSRGAIDARTVVVAGGPFQVPHVPALASGLAPSIRQLHAHDYRRPEDLPPGRVLLVGSGQTGVQLAEELHAVGREVMLSVGRCGSVPRRYRDHDIFWWLRQMATRGREIGVGLPTPADLPSPAARFACNPQLSGHRGGHSVSLRGMAADGIRLIGRLQTAEGTTARFAGDLQENVRMAEGFFETRFRPEIEAFIERSGEGAPGNDATPPAPAPAGLPELPDVLALDLEAENVSTVVWTSGYRPAFGWIKPPVLDEFGLPMGTGGVTPVDGLVFIGLPWMVDMASANLVGLVRDAEALVARLLMRRP